jgi:hypothetical protein
LGFIGDLVAGWDRSIPFAKKPDEERTAMLNLIEAHLQHLPLLRLFCGHTPAKIDINKVQISLNTARAELRKHETDQMIALRMHIPKSR